MHGAKEKDENLSAWKLQVSPVMLTPGPSQVEHGNYPLFEYTLQKKSFKPKVFTFLWTHLTLTVRILHSKK